MSEYSPTKEQKEFIEKLGFIEQDGNSHYFLKYNLNCWIYHFEKLTTVKFRYVQGFDNHNWTDLATEFTVKHELFEKKFQDYLTAIESMIEIAKNLEGK